MSKHIELKKSIKDYWENPNTISIIDSNLHKLEIDTVCRYLRVSDNLADIGCANAKATLNYATKVYKCTGFERSTYLLKKARAAVSRSGIKNIVIRYGEILDMGHIQNEFSAVVTQRMLINLVSWREQKQAIINIHRMLKPRGRYIMIENTEDAFRALNKMRAMMGLNPVAKHWHNLFFVYKKLVRFLRDKFKIIDFQDFGLYYFLTRIYVQMFAPFVGYGRNIKKDPIFDKSDTAARIIFEKLHDCIKIEGIRALGPIHAFILERKN